MRELLDDPAILTTKVRAHAGVNNLEGTGIIEAPRGTLIHHYKVDDNGAMTWANLIVATGHNNLAISRGVLQVARRFVDGNRIQEGALNRVSALVRAYDPCLSCSTHALGMVPVVLELQGPGGECRRGRDQLAASVPERPATRGPAAGGRSWQRGQSRWSTHSSGEPSGGAALDLLVRSELRSPRQLERGGRLRLRRATTCIGRSRWRSGASSGARGRANRYPWPRSQSRSCRSDACSSVSIPSAVTHRLSVRPSATTLSTMAVS